MTINHLNGKREVLRTATITKRKDSYQITSSCGYDSNGKQVRKTMTFKPAPGMTQKQIEKELQKQATLFDVQCQNGFSISGNVKFETFAKEYLKQIELEKELKDL